MGKTKHKFLKEKKISSFSAEKRLSNFKQRGYFHWNDEDENEDEEIWKDFTETDGEDFETDE